MAANPKSALDSTRINFADPAIKANPYPTYARLREEAPICKVRLWGVPAWLVTRYDDVLATLKDPRLVNDRRNTTMKGRPLRERFVYHMFGALNRNMLGSDEPDHGRLRALVQKAFTQRRVEQMRSRIESLTQDLLDRVATRGQMDIVHDYALPLPATIIGEMLGVPMEDRERFHHFSDSILTLTDMGPGAILKAGPTLLAFRRFLRKLVRLRRAQPQDDLVSALAAAEEAGEKLSDDELVAMISLLLIAGHETTVNLIGNGVLALLDSPAQLEKLRARPALMPSAVEELLRYDGPLEVANTRFAREDFNLNGANIQRGDPVFACLASANRDHRQFDHPDVLDLAREPNRHVAFGYGGHYCLGAFLARMEAQIAFTNLLGRFPDLRLNMPRNTVQRRKSLVLRGLRELRVAF